MIRSLVVALAALAALAPGAVAVAAPSPVAAYKARVNAACAVQTRTAIAYGRKLAAAQRGDDPEAFARVFIAYTRALDRQGREWLAFPVPAGAAREMAPILALERRAQAIVGKALGVGSLDAVIDALLAAEPIGKRLDPLFDRAGLTACGSAQTAARTGAG